MADIGKGDWVECVCLDHPCDLPGPTLTLGSVYQIAGTPCGIEEYHHICMCGRQEWLLLANKGDRRYCTHLFKPAFGGHEDEILREVDEPVKVGEPA